VRERFRHMLFDGPNGNTLKSCDFGVLEPSKQTEHEDIPSTLRQLPEAFRQLRDGFSPQVRRLSGEKSESCGTEIASCSFEKRSRTAGYDGNGSLSVLAAVWKM